jgi:hypothetical protein
MSRSPVAVVGAVWKSGVWARDDDRLPFRYHVNRVSRLLHVKVVNTVDSGPDGKVRIIPYGTLLSQ